MESWLTDCLHRAHQTECPMFISGCPLVGLGMTIILYVHMPLIRAYFNINLYMEHFEREALLSASNP